MDEKLQRQLIKQIKWLNILITSFGILFLVGLAIIGFMLFTVITFVRDTSNSIQQFQQSTSDSVNIQQQACRQEGAIGDLLRNQTDICN